MLTRLFVALLVCSCAACALRPVQRSTAVPPRVALPLTFEQNAGQIATQYDYLTRAAAYDAAFHARGVTFALKNRAADDASIVALGFRGARPIHPAPQAPLRGRVSYLRGSNQRNWIRNAPTYERLHYRDIYPDVDLVFYGNEQQLEYDFVVAPRADPSHIAMTFDGADDVRTNGDGDLVVTAGDRELVQKRPIAFQEHDGVRIAVDASYAIAADRAVTIRLGAYDRTRPLTIDPMIVMARRFGGADFDDHADVVFSGGALYLAGTTCSPDFPTANAMQPALHGTACDGFITKMTADGRSLVYSTYFGGESMERLHAFAVDRGGAVYVTGSTLSQDFPTTAGAFDRACGNDGACGRATPGANVGSDGFVSKIAVDGSSIVYSTYIGGSDSDDAIAIAVNSAGEALITGQTSSIDYPTTAGAVSRSLSGVRDVLMAKLAADGGSLVYSTYFGGGSTETGFAAAFDAAGNAWIFGDTNSTNIPIMGAFQPSLGNPSNTQLTDAFIVKLTPTGSLALSTYFGGDGGDSARGLALDATGIYVTGTTYSTAMPGTSGSRDLKAKENAGYVAQLAADGSHVIRTQLLDGRFGDSVSAVAVARPSGAFVLHVAGTTNSPDFPVSADAFQTMLDLTDAGGDLFYATFQLDAGGALAPRTYATLFGGEGSGGTFPSLAVEGGDGVFVVGSTSQTFPLINPPLPTGGSRIFIAHLQPRDRWTESTAGEVHLYASDATAVGSEWSLVADSSAADGRRAANVDRGAVKVVTPLMNPSSYVDFTFDADAGTAYRVWMRGKAANNSYSNDSVFAQFSDSVDAAGNAVWRIGSTSATPMILEDCLGCNVHGWGWSDNGYGAGVLGPAVRFASTGRHTLRFQAREDGLSIDQVVLSSAENLSTAPGTTKDDTTVLKRTLTAAPPDETCVAGEVVIHMSGTGGGAGTWTAVSDPTAASGVRMFQPDAGAPKITNASASPANYFEKTFAADANTNYRIWIRGKAQNDFWGNDSVFVQFTDSQDTNGTATWRVGTNSAAEVNLEDCSGCGLKSWGWQDNGWGVGVAGPLVRFAASGTHTIRVQTREDGFSIDQIVLSSSKYLSAAPGALKNDTTILPACPTPPLR